MVKLQYSSLFYLASQSPRRLELLKQLGLQPEQLLPQGHEDPEGLEQVLPGEHAQDYVQRVTHLKWQAAVQRRLQMGLPDAPILCADTTVVLNRKILGKPLDLQDAQRMLRALSGRGHRVLTAVVVGQGERVEKALSISQVIFDTLTQTDINDYVNSGEPMGKAGAYGIQGRAAQWVKCIKGSYSGIMGLPLYETANLLRLFDIKTGKV